MRVQADRVLWAHMMASFGVDMMRDRPWMPSGELDERLLAWTRISAGR